MDLSFTAAGRKARTGALAFFALIAAARTAQATKYYVATTGSDSNPGTMAAPFDAGKAGEVLRQALQPFAMHPTVEGYLMRGALDVGLVRDERVAGA